MSYIIINMVVFENFIMGFSLLKVFFVLFLSFASILLYLFVIGERWRLFIKEQRFLITLVVISLIFGLIVDNRYEIFVFMSSLLSFMIGKEVEIQLEEKRKRNRFVARFRVLVSNYLRSADSLLNSTEVHSGQIDVYAKNYVDYKNEIFNFLKQETDKNLFLYDKLKGFSYVKVNDSVNVPNKVWCFDDIIGLDFLEPKDNSFYDKLITKIESTEKISYIKNNEIINTQVDVIKKISQHLGVDLESS